MGLSRVVPAAQFVRDQVAWQTPDCSGASLLPSGGRPAENTGTGSGSDCFAGRPVRQSTRTGVAYFRAPCGSPEAQPVRASKLRLCSWSPQKLGYGNAKDFIIKSVIEENCDIAAIEEVMQKSGGHPGSRNS